MSKYDELALLKIEIKVLTKEAKLLQDELLAAPHEERIETVHGPLVLCKRENWKCLNNQKVVDKVGLDAYLSGSTISKTNLVKVSTKEEFEELVEDKVVRLMSTSEYYSLK